MKKEVKKTYTKPAMKVKKSVAVVSGSGTTKNCSYYVSRTVGSTYYY